MYYLKRFWKIFLCIILSAISFSFMTLAASSIPSPTSYKYIHDYAQVLTDSGKMQIMNEGSSTQHQTGAQFIVVTIPSTDGLPIEDYAIKLFRSWGIGQAEQDNGLLILVATKDQRWRVEVGRGLEGLIPDALSNRVMSEVAKPSFAQGNYEEGILGAYTTFKNIIWDNDGTSTRPSSSSSKYSFATPLIIILVLLDLIFNRGRILSSLLQIIFISNLTGRGGGGRNGFGGGNGGGFGGGSSNGGGSSGGW